jgi:hypothetical protein
VRSVSRTTPLAAPAARVWERAGTLEGVNEEFRPILRMTAPRDLRGATIADLKPGVPAGRSWLLLGGLIPVDYDDLCIAELEPPRRFLERSEMLSMSSWQHERIIEPLGEAECSITDVLTFELRRPLRLVPGAEALAERVVAMLFRYRHRRLAAIHGSPEAG